MSSARGGLWKRFLSLLPSDPEIVATVTDVRGGGLYEVIPVSGGGGYLVRSDATYAVSAKVFVRGLSITGPAPSLPSITIDI